MQSLRTKAPVQVHDSHLLAEKRKNRGFVLITVLLLLTGLTLLGGTLFILSTNDAVQARNFNDKKKAEQAAQSAFEVAKAILIELTSREDFLVVGGIDNDPIEEFSTPYHFISIPQESGNIQHFPLWAGGQIQETEPGIKPTWNRSETLPKADGVLASLL